MGEPSETDTRGSLGICYGEERAEVAEIRGGLRRESNRVLTNHRSVQGPLWLRPIRL